MLHVMINKPDLIDLIGYGTGRPEIPGHDVSVCSVSTNLVSCWEKNVPIPAEK